LIFRPQPHRGETANTSYLILKELAWKKFGVEYTVEGVLASPHTLLGSAAQIIEKLERNREEFGFSYISIFEEDLGNFAPVVKLLSGK